MLMAWNNKGIQLMGNCQIFWKLRIRTVLQRCTVEQTRGKWQLVYFSILPPSVLCAPLFCLGLWSPAVTKELSMQWYIQRQTKWQDFNNKRFLWTCSSGMATTWRETQGTHIKAMVTKSRSPCFVLTCCANSSPSVQLLDALTKEITSGHHLD